MQELQRVQPGDTVAARARLWTVERVTHGPACAAVELAGAEARVAGRRLTLLVPFDELRPARRTAPAASVRPATAFRVLAELAADGAPWPAPHAARDARIDLHPHQLSAALALARGTARRVLVADAVGAGKTIQAGLAIARELADDPSARVLVAVPASLKAQWASELSLRFELTPQIVSAEMPTAIGAERSSPWATRGVTLASFDYLKRVDVLAGLDATWWHLLVVDEAHHLGGRSERTSALRALAERALRVLLLTATPHDGDEARFAALCGTGAHGAGDPLLVLARDPRGRAAHRRRLHEHHVAPHADERRTSELLEAYLGWLSRSGGDEETAAALIASVLRKRAASSPAALARSAARRRELLSETPPPDQLTLDFTCGAHGAPDTEEGDGDEAVLGVRVADARHERAWLGAISEAARRAGAACRKRGILIRLLRRLHEPVIVFSEYRDTLSWLHAALQWQFRCEVLHGAQSPGEREAAVEAFSRGRARVLLATDAAAEGLNLHASCRVVVLFDLPWTPARVEQRIGRVDRMGQSRRVHAWVLRTSADGPLAARLAARSARAAVPLDAGEAGTGSAGETRASAGGLDEARACVELARARAWGEAARRFGAGSPTRACLGRTVTARLRRGQLARLCGAADCALAIVRATFTRSGERVVERALWAVRLALSRQGRGRCAGDGRARRREATSAIADLAGRSARHAVEVRRAALEAALQRPAGRESAACDHVRRALRTRVAAHFVQPDLFGRTPALSDAREPDLPLPDLHPAVTATVDTPLVLVPRGWP